MARIDDAIEIFEDRRAVGDRFFMLPRFEDEAERVHVAVRTDARITEKIPVAAQLLAALHDGAATVGALHLQMHCPADTHNAGPHKQHIPLQRGHLWNPGSITS